MSEPLVPPDGTFFRWVGALPILATTPRWDTDYLPPLLAVLPEPVAGSRVLVLDPDVPPEVVDRFRAVLDAEVITK